MHGVLALNIITIASPGISSPPRCHRANLFQQMITLPNTVKKTMGSVFSRFKKSHAGASLPRQRNSSALRHRISLNKETLDRVLQQIGHPARERFRMSSTQRKWPASLRPSTPRGGEPYHKEMLQHSNFSMRFVKQGDARDANRNKPLPPFPPSTMERPQNKPQLIDPPPHPQQPPQPMPTDGPSNISKTEEELDRDFIDLQRRATLRQLERKKSRVPTLIFKRIGQAVGY